MTNALTNENRLTAVGVLTEMRSRFTSLNPISVGRAYITRDEWRTFLNELCETDIFPYSRLGEAIRESLTALEHVK